MIRTNTNHLIVIDVLKLDDTPGNIYRFTKEEMDLDITPALKDKFAVLEDLLLKELARLGVVLEKADHA